MGQFNLLGMLSIIDISYIIKAALNISCVSQCHVFKFLKLELTTVQTGTTGPTAKICRLTKFG